MSQIAQIRMALEAGARLTPIDALARFRCFRLAARVRELRESGMDVQSRMVERGGKNVAMYWLRRKPTAGKA